jgi:hypothetical protein
MNPETSARQFKRGPAWLLVSVFFVLLWLPLADSAFHLDRSQMIDERRALAQFPQFSPALAGLHDFLSGLDDYYNDHFGFRNRLIRWDHRWKRKWFHDYALANVMIGRDGWLYTTSSDMIARYRGLRSFTPPQLEAWRAVIENRRDWLAKRGIKYLLVIPPDKESVYPEFLPGWMVRVRPDSQLDQFFAYMKAHSTVQILDLRPALLEAKKTGLAFQRTDTHWNFYGSFAGYQALVRALGRQLPGLGEPLPLDAFDRHVASQKGGDLANMLGQEQSLPEREFVQFTPRPPLAALVLQTNVQILPKNWISFKVPVFTENPAAKYKILLFRDSFANGWLPLLGYNFKRAVYIWQPEWDAGVVEREQPDVVVNEMVERLFCTSDPHALEKTGD